MFYNETIATMIFSHSEDNSHVIWLTRHAKNSNSMTGVSHNFSQACSSSFGDCHLKIPVIGLFHCFLEFLVVAVVAVASQVASSHSINNTQSFADTDDNRCSRWSA